MRSIAASRPFRILAVASIKIVPDGNRRRKAVVANLLFVRNYRKAIFKATYFSLFTFGFSLNKPFAENLREQPGVKRSDDDGDGVGENFAPQRIDELAHF